jgi:hypothetical protein
VSIIPLDLQRKFEQRLAARFLRPPVPPQAHRPESQRQQLAVPDKSKEKPAGLSRRVRSLPLVEEDDMATDDEILATFRN